MLNFAVRSSSGDPRRQCEWANAWKTEDGRTLKQLDEQTDSLLSSAGTLACGSPHAAAPI
jgi:hypothetical protein